MHAAIFRVTIKDREKAEQYVKEQLVPYATQVPGFVTGYWVNFGQTGASVVVFESEDAATQATTGGEEPPADAVTIESMDIGEVVGHA